MITRTIFLSAGHSNVPGKDQGASAGTYIEGDLAVEVRQILTEKLTEKGITPALDPDSNITAETIRYFMTQVQPNDIAVDIHFNAATPQATGVEVIIPKNYSPIEKKLAEDISNIISTTLSIKNRGVHTEDQTPRKQLGFMRLKCETILIEVCFITNLSDMESFEINKILMAERIADCLISI